MRYVTIPTRFGRSTVHPLIDVCRQLATVVLVQTEAGHPNVPGTVTIRSYARNIHTWWNMGLNRCDGPTLVLNDDLIADRPSLQAMFDALETSDVVHLTGREAGTTPFTGYCFGLHPNQIRPDESYTWWFGDDDLWQRAKAKGLTVTPLNLPGIVHAPRTHMFEDPHLQEAAQWDRDLYLRRWSSAPTQTAQDGLRTA